MLILGFSEKKLAAITATLEETNQKLAESNKLAQTSSADLTMQVIRHQQEIDGLKKEIAVWEAKPRLDDMLSELEEKNNELEELLRAKSEEIDENDEKILEFVAPSLVSPVPMLINCLKDSAREEEGTREGGLVDKEGAAAANQASGDEILGSARSTSTSCASQGIFQ